MNLLGGLDRAVTAGILEKLKQCGNTDLAKFAVVRAEIK